MPQVPERGTRVYLQSLAYCLMHNAATDVTDSHILTCHARRSASQTIFG